ncbi:hypothetical protein [Kamptonema sp. UHCC 0994]|uniref:hypothetical protein n=1 Tax=Kamptonema sp. UHCC 0994 TaxID=3031329 RepID=UPI0023B9309C|nr:hypothetical protein [Kamptonema sp. UHCC 0994]MDF0552673.1 hypothetical protein [Kamptonema sp. UHCC 0994]
MSDRHSYPEAVTILAIAPTPKTRSSALFTCQTVDPTTSAIALYLITVRKTEKNPCMGVQGRAKYGLLVEVQS